MNPMDIMKIMNAKSQFEKAHPKFSAFLQDLFVYGVEADSIIEIKIIKPDGTPVTANMRVQQSDIDLIQQLKDLRP